MTTFQRRGRTSSLSMLGKPPHQMLQPSQLEVLTKELVTAIVEYGKVEQGVGRNRVSSESPTRRVLYYREAARSKLRRLQDLLQETPILAVRVRTLLAHHYFSLVRGGVLEVTRQKLKALDKALGSSKPGHNGNLEDLLIPEEDSCGARGTRSIALQREDPSTREAHVPTVLLLDHNKHGMPTQWENLASVAIQARREAQRKIRTFVKWQNIVVLRKRACSTIWAALRCYRVKAMAQAFSRLVRHSIFKQAIALALRESECLKHSLKDSRYQDTKVKQKRAASMRHGFKPSDAGIHNRRLPWER